MPFPLCRKCNETVKTFEVGRDQRDGRHICYYESGCHGETERVEYWPASLRDPPFEPAQAFPAEYPPADVALAEPPEPERSVRFLQDELDKMPEWVQLTRIKNFGKSIRLLERNARELQKLLHFLTIDPASMPLTDVRRRSELDRTFEEVLHLLHNFVAAALTLVDHTRVLHRELYAATETFSDYEMEVRRRFVDSPLIQFVQKLRQMTQHVRLPDISLNLVMTTEAGTTRRLVLKKDDLLEFSAWTAPAKRYLAHAAEQIDLSEVVHAYLEEIRAFYGWMTERQRQIHAADLQAVESKEAELRAAMAKDLVGIVQSDLNLYDQGIGSFQLILGAMLFSDDWTDLSPHEGDPILWMDAALELVQKQFGPLPADLVVRIKKAVRGDK